MSEEVKHVLDTNVYGIAQADTILKMKGAIAETANWIKNYILDRAGMIYVGSGENCQLILDFFNIPDIIIESSPNNKVYRYIEEDSANAPVSGYKYKFGLLNPITYEVSTSDIIYSNNRDTNSIGNYVYADSNTSYSIYDIDYPTEGFVLLETPAWNGENPLHVKSNTIYLS